MKTHSFFDIALRPILFQLDAETAHNIAIAALQRASPSALLRRLLRRFAPAENPRTLFGIRFPNPIGLAAGFDKNGVALPALAAMGFGFIEIGTVTGRPQPGNPRPRIFRYPEERALINRLGFNNDGADLVANRLRRLRETNRWPTIPVGINIGKSKDVSLDQAPADYLHSFRRLQPFADYVVLNVSSPNTPGLRTLQKSELLATLLDSVQNENRTNRPIVVKFSPDLVDEDIDEIVKTCEDYRVAAIIATNTTLNHSALPPEKDQTGGLSGEPLRRRSTDLIRRISTATAIPVIGCGGIMDAESAREKFEAGSQLIQVYTGLVYRGPGFLREISAAYDTMA
jgi:dihydroorotate dehydrogenase